ncbi:MAG TPA: hypothetical protein PKC43_12025 [Phycisphaerales bacterium]|nr:hypothetical protein [Phycisphaerales bacterium]HMP38159.1 hypothetical protein [Phycisphaerales bacterium]
MTEKELLDRLAKIESLMAGTSFDGERDAAAVARERLRERLRALQGEDPPVEMRFAVHDPWSRKLLLALLRRYGVSPYRRRGQHRQSVMARVSERWVNETLWPHFTQASAALRQHLEEVAVGVIRAAVGDPRDEQELAAGEVQQLPGGS